MACGHGCSRAMSVQSDDKKLPTASKTTHGHGHAMFIGGESDDGEEWLPTACKTARGHGHAVSVGRESDVGKEQFPIAQHGRIILCL